MTLRLGLVAALLVPGVAVADHPHRLELGVQAGRAFDELAVGPQVSFSRQIAGRGRVDVVAGTTQVYRLTPFFDKESQLGAGTSRSAFRHHYSALVGPGIAVRLPPADRLLVGLDVLAGATYVRLAGSYTNPAVGIDRSYSTSDLGFTLGARVSLSFRIGCRWAALVSLWAPLISPPSASSHMGLGAGYVF